MNCNVNRKIHPRLIFILDSTLSVLNKLWIANSIMNRMENRKILTTMSPMQIYISHIEGLFREL